MEAHRSYERFEQGRNVAAGEELPRHAQKAALAVAVIAGFLAVATFASNEALKEVITGETQGAVAAARLESNRVKIDTVAGTASVLQALGASGPTNPAAAARAQTLRARVLRRLHPADVRLAQEIETNQDEVDNANDRHLALELAEVGFEIGIVLASVSIIARRRWLLVGAGGAAAAGVVLLAVGLLS